MDARIEIENRAANRFHPELDVYVIDNQVIAVGEVYNDRAIGLYAPCRRCAYGLGHFMHNGQDDICYLCGGQAHSTDETTLEDAVRRFDARQKRLAAAARKRLQEARDAAHDLALWMDENPAVVEALKPFETRQGFLGDMARTVAEGRKLTQKQHDAVVAAFEKMAERAGATAGHWGTVGVRGELTAAVTKIISLPDNGFGPSTLIKLRTEEGHELVTFTTAAWSWEAHEGDVYTGKATVKKHDAYNGIPQTTLTRAAFKRVSDSQE